MKYIVKEDIYLKDIYKASFRCEFLEEFKDFIFTIWRYGDYYLLDEDTIIFNKEYILDEGSIMDDWFLQDCKRLSWLCVNFNIEEMSETIYKTGDRFICKDSLFYNEEHILAQVTKEKVALISLGNSSNRWNEAVVVDDIHNITEEEFAKITGGTEFVKK